MKAALYTRVSTRDQSCEMQVRELKEYCERRGWEVFDPPPIPGGVGANQLKLIQNSSISFRDLALSGSAKSRPALDALMSDARRKKFDVVVVYRYDRFARSLHHLVSAFEEFRSLGIDFVSLHEQIDTTTPNGRLVFGIMASITEFERELIRERVRSGVAAAIARGKKPGRPRLAVDRNLVHSLIGEKVSIREISKRLQISPSSVHRIRRQGVPKPQI